MLKRNLTVLVVNKLRYEIDNKQDNKFYMKKRVGRINSTINLRYDFSVLKQTFEETK